MSKYQITPIEEMFEALEEGVENWKKINTPKVIKQKIKETLDKNQREIILKLLGFDADHFGNKGFTLDHCNGRSGNSIAGDYLRNTANDAILEWLDSTDFKVIKPMTKTSIQEEYNRVFKQEVIATVRNKAKEHAEDVIEEVMEEISNTNFYEAREKIKALLTRDYENE